MSDEEPVLSGYHQKGSLASQVTGATGGKTRAAIRAARNEAYKRRDATKAANMRKRTLPEKVGSDGIDVRAPRYIPHNDTP